jgi:hypothetical protein
MPKIVKYGRKWKRRQRSPIYGKYWELGSIWKNWKILGIEVI